MTSRNLLLVLFLVLFDNGYCRRLLDYSSSFDANYYIAWGGDHAVLQNQGQQIQLTLDKSCGAGFSSNEFYGSGFFRQKIKIPGGDTAGVVTAFYLSSPHTSNHDRHDELDFEFLGNLNTSLYELQTNVFVNGQGNREQKVHLWFDPTTDFHDYGILWNPSQIVFFVDNIPIRVFNNNTVLGVGYPSQPMQIMSSLWDGESWATDNGKIKTNWTQAPFVAYYQEFGVDGCSDDSESSCTSSDFWWNGGDCTSLNANQQSLMDTARKLYMIYDYCTDESKYPDPQECSH